MSNTSAELEKCKALLQIIASTMMIHAELLKALSREQELLPQALTHRGRYKRRHRERLPGSPEDYEKLANMFYACAELAQDVVSREQFERDLSILQKTLKKFQPIVNETTSDKIGKQIELIERVKNGGWIVPEDIPRLESL